MRDVVSPEVTVLTVYDRLGDNWTTTVVGGPVDGYSRAYRDDPAAQHARAIELAKDAS